VAVLCSVGLDHRDWLGDTLELIGAEKAGIFRAGQAVVLGNPGMPASVWERAAALHCRVHVAQRDFEARIHGRGDRPEPWDFRSALCKLDDLPPPALAGTIQYQNAAAALMALNLLGVPGACERDRIARGLQSVSLPGRFQRIPGEVEWVLDVAHNEPAAAVLAAELRSQPVRGRTIAVAGMLADKDAAAVARELDGVIDHWLLVDLSDEPRGLTAAALQARLPPLRGVLELMANVAAACARARELARPRDRIVVLGSFHVVGPALAWLGLY